MLRIIDLPKLIPGVRDNYQAPLPRRSRADWISEATLARAREQARRMQDNQRIITEAKKRGWRPSAA